MKRAMELTIPILVGLTWAVLAVATLYDVGKLSRTVVQEQAPAARDGGQHPLSCAKVVGARGGLARC